MYANEFKNKGKPKIHRNKKLTATYTMYLFLSLLMDDNEFKAKGKIETKDKIKPQQTYTRIS